MIKTTISNNKDDNYSNQLVTNMYIFILILTNHNKTKSKWIDFIKRVIETNDCTNVWLNQEKYNKKWFRRVFKISIKDQCSQSHIVQNH